MIPLPQTSSFTHTIPRSSINALHVLATSDGTLPHLPSVERWRKTDRAKPYDPNALASRTEMRSFVCGQCHVEYYCSSKLPLEFPWSKGLLADQIEAHWNERKFPDGERFYDYKHAATPDCPVDVFSHVDDWFHAPVTSVPTHLKVDIRHRVSSRSISVGSLRHLRSDFAPLITAENRDSIRTSLITSVNPL